MSMNMIMIRKKVWDMIMLFVITNGFGGAILFLQNMCAKNKRLAKYSTFAPEAGECAA